MKYFEIPSGKCTTDRQRKYYRNNTTGTISSYSMSVASYLLMNINEFGAMTVSSQV